MWSASPLSEQRVVIGAVLGPVRSSPLAQAGLDALPVLGPHLAAHLVELFDDWVAIDELVELLAHTALQEELLRLQCLDLPTEDQRGGE